MTPNGPFAMAGSNGVHLAGGVVVPSNEEVGIREVWSHNLEEEFKSICQVVLKYPFVAMDTEFPGVVARPIGKLKVRLCSLCLKCFSSFFLCSQVSSVPRLTTSTSCSDATWTC